LGLERAGELAQVLVLVLVPELVQARDQVWVAVSVLALVLVQATAAGDRVKDWVLEQEFLVEAEDWELD
jgi:hypothetical protein